MKWNVMVDFHDDSNLRSTDFAVRYSEVNKSDAKKTSTTQTAGSTIIKFLTLEL